MSQNLRNYTKALYALDAVVARTSADAWSNASPCADWQAKEVLGHCIWGAQRVAAQASRAELPGEMVEADVAGEDPAASWGAARDAVMSALDQPGALAQQVQGFGGMQSLDQSLGIMTMDLTVHSWDLAKATGQQPAVPGDLAMAAYEGIKQFGDAARSPGIFDAEVAHDDVSDPGDRLAAMAGRQI